MLGLFKGGLVVPRARPQGEVRPAQGLVEPTRHPDHNPRQISIVFWCRTPFAFQGVGGASTPPPMTSRPHSDPPPPHTQQANGCRLQQRSKGPLLPTNSAHCCTCLGPLYSYCYSYALSVSRHPSPCSIRHPSEALFADFM